MILKGGLCFLLPVISNIFLQSSQYDFNLKSTMELLSGDYKATFVMTSLIIMVIFLFFIFIIGQYWVGCGFFVVFFGIIGFANYQKIRYRGEPIYPEDLKMITELDLLKKMASPIVFWICLLLIILCAIFILYFFVKSLKLRGLKQLVRITGLVVTSLALGYIFMFNRDNNRLRALYDEKVTWTPIHQLVMYQNVGFVPGFLYNLSGDLMKKEANYSKESIEKIVNKYQKLAAESKNDEKPDIVYIMDESFSDPSALNGLTLNDDPIKEFRSLANDKGNLYNMLSQGYGGGTGNIEYEALTSFSMETLEPQIMTPYSSVVPTVSEFPSLVSYLKQQGYKSTAIHPYNASMYKRSEVYSKFGFSKFIDETSMKYDEKIEENPYISDESAFDQVEYELNKNKAGSNFIFLVTMQNHMPYEEKYQNTNYYFEEYKDNAEMNNYLEDISLTSKALSSFIDKINQREKRTIVVFWGDHLPGIYPDEIKKQNSEEILHKTPLLIYDNKGELEKETEQKDYSSMYITPTTLNSANMKSSGFYALTNQLQQVLPAFENGLYLSNGIWSENLKLSEQDRTVYEEYKLIQYDILMGKKYSLKMNFFKEK